MPHGGGRIAARGGDLTSVRCGGPWLTVGISVAAVKGTVLRLDLLPNGETATLSGWVQDLATALGAEIRVSDDADPFKTAADASGLSHQVCTAPVRRTAEAGVRAVVPRPWLATAMAPSPASGCVRSRRRAIARSCCAG